MTAGRNAVTHATCSHQRTSSVYASVKKASHMGADVNHLCPTRVYSPPGPPPATGVALVVFARTSDPPCFSVIDMPGANSQHAWASATTARRAHSVNAPMVAPVFMDTGMSRPS